MLFFCSYDIITYFHIINGFYLKEYTYLFNAATTLKAWFTDIAVIEP